MTRVAGLALVLLISGVPATALLCGASCLELTRPTADACHGHASGPQPDCITVPPHHDCHHAPAFAFFVTEPKQRGTALPGVTLAIVEAEYAVVRANDSLIPTPTLRGSPPRSAASHSPVLRI